VVHGRNQQKEQPGKADHLRQRNPRTAIGWNDREFFMVVVDGRKADLSVGMTFPELAALMVRLGCKEAMNLDGGGSTTMWLNGKVINHPSEKGVLRHVANTLVLVQKP
jgi:exopolysaccharide biosynthesis protein